MVQEEIFLEMRGSEKEREEVNNTCQLLIECMRLNGISKTSGVSACISIALSELYAKGASHTTINKILRLFEQTQAEIIKVHPELERKA